MSDSRTPQTPVSPSGGDPERDNAGPSPDVFRAVHQAVASDLAPVRMRSLPMRLLGLAIFALASLTIAGIGFGARVAAPLEHPTEVAIGVAVVLASIVLAARFLSPTGGQSSLRAKLIAALVLCAVWFIFLATRIRGAGLESHGGFTGCLLLSALAGVLCVFAGLWFWRNTDPWSPVGSGALLGTIAGCIGAAGIGIVCADRGGAHLLVGHGLTLPLLACLGALLARKTLRP